MATGYGGWLASDDWRARVDANITTTKDDSVVVTVQAKIQSAYTSTSYAKGRAGKSGSYGGWVSRSISAGSTTTMTSATYTVSRTHEDQSVQFNAQGNVYSSGYGGNGTSTAKVSLTIPARQSYTITFNANGGSGVPGDQTKWYGETLTLPTTVPTRSGYDFAGWATSATATSAAYSAGGDYTPNAAATLYAVWSRAYIAPKISSLSVYRASNTSGTAADEGKYCYVKCTWSVDTTLTSGNKGQTLSIEYKTAAATSWTSAKSVALSAASATTSTAALDTASFDTSTTYNVRVTVSDTSGQTGNTASATATLSPAFYTIDFRAGGHGLGIGHAADVADTVNVGMALRMADKNINVVDASLPSSGAPSSDVWGKGLHLYDVGGVRVGYLRGFHLTSGYRGVQLAARRTANGTDIENALNLHVNASGTRYVGMTDPAAWRTALGETAWADLPLSDNVVAYDEESTPKYKKIVGALVTITGAVKPKASVASGATLVIGTLPTGFRPPRYVNCLCQGTGGSQWLLGVNEDGTVDCSRYRNGSSNTSISTSNWLTFHYVFAL
jgi:uncharacterized repeat protein (TIGR02543 family)